MVRILVFLGLAAQVGLAFGGVEMLRWTVNMTESPESEQIPFDYAQLRIYQQVGGGEIVALELYCSEHGGLEPAYTYQPGMGNPIPSQWCNEDGRTWELSDRAAGHGGGGLKLDGTTGEVYAGIPEIIQDHDDVAFYFQLELYNEDWELLNDLDKTLLVSYADLVSVKAIGDNVLTPIRTWNAIGPAPVPEPTGGVLVLLGAALLGLRRKKVDA